MSQKKKKATINLYTDVVNKRQKPPWREAVQDRLFMKDISVIETEFRVADNVIAEL